MITREFIDEMIKDVLEVESRLKMMDKLVGSIEDGNLRHQYNREIVDLVEIYKLLEEELIIKINEYIKQESDDNKPVNIYYRRVLKNLTK